MARNSVISLTAAVTLFTAAFAPASLAAEQKPVPGDGNQDQLAQNFQAEHEIGRRFHIRPERPADAEERTDRDGPVAGRPL
jgi:hypothetical protein